MSDGERPRETNKEQPAPVYQTETSLGKKAG